jgi:hypothetical protein
MSGFSEVEEYFEAFAAAFSKFDGAVVGQLFICPGVALRRDGTLCGFATQTDIATYYQAALDRYRDAGCRACRYANLEIHPIGADGVVATVTWDLLRDDGTVIDSWRQAYSMRRFADGWRTYTSAFVKP